MSFQEFLDMLQNSFSGAMAPGGGSTAIPGLGARETGVVNGPPLPPDPNAGQAIPGLGARETGVVNGPPIPPAQPVNGPAVPGAPIAGANAGVGSPGGFQARPPVGAGMSQDAQRARNQALFADADPQTALINAMKDAGMNPYADNPLIARMLGSANGLQSAFLLKQALGGATNSGVEAAGGEGGMLRDYMMQALQSGDMGGEINSARGMVNNVPGFLNDYAKRRTTTGLGVDENPFIGMLESAFTDPQKTQALLSGMTTPGLGSRELSQSYNRGLAAALSGQRRNQLENLWADTQASGDPNNPSLGSNFWNYIR